VVLIQVYGVWTKVLIKQPKEGILSETFP